MPPFRANPCQSVARPDDRPSRVSRAAQEPAPRGRIVMAKAAKPTVEDVQAVLGAVDPEQVKKVLALGKKAWPYAFRAERDLVKLRATLQAAFQPGEKGNAPGAKRYKVAGR